jgi:hypothetical protein
MAKSKGKPRKDDQARSAHLVAAVSVAGRTNLGAEDLPRRTLQDSLALARALHSTYAGKSASWEELCATCEISKQTNSTKYLFWAAKAYGILTKETTGQIFSLSETGRKIVAPTYDGEDREGILKAVLTPTLLSKFYTDYNGHPIPGPSHFPNVLETRFGIPRDRVAEATTIILDNAAFAGILEDTGTGENRINVSGSSLPAPSPDAPASDTNIGEAKSTGSAHPRAALDWSKICFIITPIGSDTSDERRHADMMLKHLLGPVADQFSLQIVRADKIEKSGLITQQIFEHLAKARLCITDLSFNNPNVFYELGVRHVCKLPTIQIIRKGDKIPFDVSQGRTIVIDTSDVYTIMDRFDSARRELSEHMKHIVSGGEHEAGDDNPVNVYLPGLKVTIPV